MYSIITIILFFIYLWGLGFSATYFVKKAEDFWERHLMNLGIGLGIFAILSIILNFLHIPLDWKIFLILSMIIPIYDLIKRIKKKELSFSNLFNFSNFKSYLKLTKSNLALLAVIFIVLVSFYIYTKGAFSYPYLEDDDPWGHSEGMKYVALEKTAYDPIYAQFYPDKQDIVLSYIDPYPPAYDILIGILHQTSPDLNWTMKFFNALIISLGFLFFYLWAKLFTGNRNHALLATFILASLPSYLSHFIWAHALSLTLFFPTLYAFHQIQSDKRWTIPAILLVAGIWVSQNMEQPVKLTTLLLIYVIVFSIANRKWYKYETLAVIGGFFLSLVWWLSVALKHSFSVILRNYGVISASAAENLNLTVVAVSTAAKQSFLIKIYSALTNPGGSASRSYTFSDFFYAKGENMINNPIGIGIIVFILVVIGLIYVLWKYRLELFTPEKAWLGLTLFWLVYGFWGVNGMTFPISIARGAFRTWIILAIPVSILAAEGFYFLTRLNKQKVFCGIIGVLLITGIIFTSAVPKYELNTATWPTSGAFTSIPEAFEYGAWFKTIPPDTKVFLYSVKQKIVIGFGGYSCSWCEDELIFKENILDQTVPELYTFLKSKQYEYLIINPSIDYQKFKSKYGEEETKQKLSLRYKEIESSGLFQMVYQKGFVVLKLK